MNLLLTTVICLLVRLHSVVGQQPTPPSGGTPVVVVTWDYQDATQKAWDVLNTLKASSLDAIEASCSLCEEQRCRRTVGYGGSPDERGETTLDALIMDGTTMDVGAVGGLRRVKSAASVARKVLENTKHSLLGGDLATEFALNMGFREESLETMESQKMWMNWKVNNCQPNFWKNVVPDSSKYCGPYHPKLLGNVGNSIDNNLVGSEDNHDTIAVLSIDSQGNIAAGTSTNGAKNKIPGRIGDSPIPGAGAYADQTVGAAASTGDGDVMMRFVPSFLAVEEMRRGATPKEAATTAILRIAQHYPAFFGAVIAVNKEGEYGAACNGMTSFPYFVANPKLGKPVMYNEKCIDSCYCVVGTNGKC